MAIVTSGSKKFSPDFQPSGVNQGTEVLIELAAVMVAAGWIAVDFSDGSSVTTSATPATFAQLDTLNAWQRFRAPTGTMEVIWQRGNGDRQWKLVLDDDGYNNDGTSTVMPTPKGTEENLVGTRSAVASWIWTATGANNYKWNICVDSVASAGGFYYFHLFSNVTGTRAKHNIVIFAPTKSGTYPVEDIAPWVATNLTTSMSSSTTWDGWFKKGLSGAALGTSLTGNNDGPFPSTGPVNPNSGKHDFQRILLDDSSGVEIQIKGRTVDCFWPASTIAALPENDTLNLATAWTAVSEGDPGAVYRWHNILLPWPHGVTPVP